MEDEERAALISAMYDNEDEPETDSKPTNVETPGFNRTRTIRVGPIPYEVPTVEYVMRLEQMVTRQAHIIEQQRQSIERLKGFVLSTRNFIRRQTTRIADLQEGLDGKVDLRDYT